MKLVTVDYEVYKFEELDKKIQEKVIQDYFEHTGVHENNVFFEEFANQVLTEIGFIESKVSYSLGYCQGDGLTFDFSLNHWELIEFLKNIKNRELTISLKNLEKELYEIVKNFEIDEKIIEEYDISVYTEKNYHGNWYYHSKTRNIVVEAYTFPLNDTEDNDEKVVTYLEELKIVFYEIYLTVCEALESEGYRQIYYMPTVEEFAELAEVNDWEYLKNGERFLK